ncbi:hypothetical protein F511_36314 [Dorcoceras hygrometricum]|uniref:Uncharacterized protein n=1 Tax=Dorcoceras hygrometricum TaxID=472368 RepID=A0A2Z7DJF7_9LAMI|nr:hypothetical protein F511_36314 [Dorcoceras hygrometricum]
MLISCCANVNESDVDAKRNLESAMMKTTFLLEEAVISNYDKMLKMKQQVTVDEAVEDETTSYCDEAVEESETDEVIEQKLLADTITEVVGHTITISDDSNH